MKNFRKVLSKTVAPLYFADTYAHRHTQTFKKGLSNDGYGETIPEHALPFAKRVEDRRDSGRHKGA